MKSLLSVLRVEELMPFHLERLGLIDSTDFSSVRRKAAEDLRKQGISPSDEYLDEAILALKQYYAIAFLDPFNMHAVSDTIDPFWHAHILHTLDYMEFCHRTVGGYMHHDPLDHANTARLSGAARVYSYTMKCFERFFSYVNSDFFPQALPEPRLICFHFNNTIGAYTLAAEHALLSAKPEMQPEAVLV